MAASDWPGPSAVSEQWTTSLRTTSSVTSPTPRSPGPRRAPPGGRRGPGGRPRVAVVARPELVLRFQRGQPDVRVALPVEQSVELLLDAVEFLCRAHHRHTAQDREKRLPQ